MTEDECCKYWVPARLAFRLSKDEDGYPAAKRLAEALGYEYPEIEHWRNMELTPELKQSLVALPGILRSPHRDTLIKAMQARRGYVARSDSECTAKTEQS
jgi:hypothetical protein